MIPTRRQFLLGAAGLVLLGSKTMPTLADNTAGPAAKPIALLYDALLAAMKGGAEMGFKGRYAAIEPALRSAFDIAEMTRRAVGPSWAKAGADQQAQMIDVFARYMIATYAANFKRFEGQSFAIGGAHPLASMDVLVRTTLKPASGDPVELNYLCRVDPSGTWRVIDIYLAGSVSEIVRLRSDFASTLRAGGLPALAKALEAKIGELGAD